MPGTYACTGCFPGSSAIKSVSQSDLVKLTYSTAYKTGVPGKVTSPVDKWENFIDIHNVGKKDTKYMKFQKMTAPLLDRSACGNRRDFVALPLGDNIINKELAENFKGGLKGGAAGLDVSAKNDSSYKGEFVAFSPERSKSAKPRSFKPKQSRTSTITGMTDLLETKGTSHMTYTTPEASLAKAAEIVLAKPNLGFAGSWQGPPPKSAYKHEFCRSGKNQQLGKSASTPEIGRLGGHEDDRPSVLLPDDHPSFQMRRMVYMSPGM